ncbi:hypothetical protein [Paraburkholderia sp. RL17-373-BIF-A]|uniref:hypothetical protein n=1 Tax=Paraburkholderia sp. RL17-373-BIF-A TaxID=3031629 RepID=UPI0038BCBD38
MDEKESLPQHVVERRKCSGGFSARSRDGGGKARDHRFLDRCARAAETQKEKANASLTLVACGVSSSMERAIHQTMPTRFRATRVNQFIKKRSGAPAASSARRMCNRITESAKAPLHRSRAILQK